MAGSKKIIKQVKEPKDNLIIHNENPDKYYMQHPAWNFSSCDQIRWSLFSENVQKIFWHEILPHFQGWETQTWGNILIDSKKQNHSIHIESLNKIALNRLSELYIEAEALISLRLTATHRIYGYIKGQIFNILWIDLFHGDNTTCVCRSRKKHT